MRLRVSALVLLLAAFAAIPAAADTITFNFVPVSPTDGGTVGIGNTASFCGGSPSVCITASGFLTSGTATALSQKAGGDDNGLGILNPYANGGHNEIQSNNVVQLDMGLLHATAIVMSSVTGDYYKIWGSNSAKCLSSTAVCASSTVITGNLDQIQFALAGLSGYKYIDITALNPGDVLVSSITATNTPEPGSMALLASGLLGMGGMFRRRFKA